MQAASRAKVSTAEIAKFDALAARWWDLDGPMRELHRMNRLRTGWIDERIVRRLGHGGVRLLDVGCGAGIAAEAFAQQGHDVFGLDGAGAAITAARAHAAETGIRLTYRAGAAEDLVAEGRTFQVVTALEVIEHAPEPAAFVASLSRLLEPGGLLFVSTLNRTGRSFAMAIVGAEYVAGLLPRGTHDWRRFVTPAELSAYMRKARLRMADTTGMAPGLFGAPWKLSRDTAVNYLAMAEAG